MTYHLCARSHFFAHLFHFAPDLQECEKKYKREEQENGRVTTQTQFEYAYSLVHSEYSADIKKVSKTIHP